MFRPRNFLWGMMLALAAGAGYFAWQGYQYSERVEEWRQSVPIEFPVDLSKTGVYSGSGEQITQRPCKEIIAVRLDTTQPVTRELMNGFRGTIRMFNEKNEEIGTDHAHYLNYGEWRKMPEKSLEVSAGRPWDRGRFTMRVEVESPARGLAGIPQTLFVRYELCGLEGMPALVFYVIAGICGLPGLIIAYCLARPIRTSTNEADVT